MEIRQASNAKDVRLFTTERLREEFHISGLFAADKFTDTDYVSTKELL